jgi:nucleotide-binding universal stress UspA family protein
VGSIINSVAKAEDIQMIVMGTHGKGKLDTLLLGNHSRSMIDETKHPLLLVPSGIAIQPIKKIAFATDLKEPEKDLKAIAELIPVLKKLQAELLLTHIYNGDDPTFSFKKYVEHSLAELSNKTGYSEIHYRIIKSDNTERGLDWLCEHGHIDVLAMLHHKQGFLDKILLGSHAKKMAEHISIPLLIIPTT